ncbi:MAG TPA: anti-sigma factor antagonist [Firmicutes bacterium]|jgi:stage II sporulation protein AA (anti-sigma F factor antagonist)|nr:anti-sigma factor antagonist [Candidatus Fermentithermobacillaceae bacterium]
MQIEFHMAPLFAVARVSGELDLSSAAKFRSLIDQELRKSGVPNVVVNLKNLSFIDSTGLGVLLGRHKAVKSWGGKFILTDVPPKIMSMLEMAGLMRVLETTRTEQDAIRLIEACGYVSQEEASTNE